MSLDFDNPPGLSDKTQNMIADLIEDRVLKKVADAFSDVGASLGKDRWFSSD